MTAMKVLYDTPTVTSKRHQTRIEIYYYCRKNDKIIDSIVTQNVSLTNTHTHTFFQDWELQFSITIVFNYNSNCNLLVLYTAVNHFLGIECNG